MSRERLYSRRDVRIFPVANTNDRCELKNYILQMRETFDTNERRDKGPFSYLRAYGKFPSICVSVI